MFRKEFRVKSNTQLKRTELKSLKEDILKSYQNLTEEIVSEIFPKKDRTNIVKLVTTNNETVQVYTVQNKPVFFYLKDVLLPTLYLLWKLPDMLVAFTTHRPVLSHIYNGADLMTPGVIIPPEKYGFFPVNTPAYINETTNRAALAVGVTTVSSGEISPNAKGKCLTVYHYYGDRLCSLDSYKIEPIPEMGPPGFLEVKSFAEDFPTLEDAMKPKQKQQNIHKNVVDNPECIIENIEESECDTNESTDNQCSTSENMDDLLLYSFLVVLKYSKSLTLPILTSNFYKQMTMCVSDKVVDVKKSSYKKISQFLQKMCEEEFITKKEVKKGVEAITNINKEHPKFIEFYLEQSKRPTSESNEEKAPATKNVIEGYIITASVAPVFRDFGLQKGDVVSAPDVSRYVTQFVKSRDYQDHDNKGLVHIKEELASICKGRRTATWEQIMEKVRSSMKSCYSIGTTNSIRSDVNKGKLEPITMIISTRSSNKKVTLVDNLELYGISIRDFAKECQHGAAASTTINQIPGKKSQQLLVQGNQINFINKLLRDVYKIPVKYIRGTEFGLKK